MAEACSRNADTKYAYRTSVGKPEVTRLLGRYRLDGRIILKWVLKR
jgi:hypothetical protein